MLSSVTNAKIIQQVGLTESEADLYIAGLRLGPATAIQLAKKISFSRQMVYTLLERLTIKGLVKEVNNGKQRLFQTIGPEVLNDRVKQIASEIETIVPLLKTQEASNISLPTITIYDNPLSMREWYRNFMAMARPGEELLIWATNQTWYQIDPEFLSTFIDFKRRIGTADRIIAPDTIPSHRFIKNNPQPNAEFRFVADWWQTATEKWIWRDTLSYLTIRENATNLIVIKSEQLVALERFNFEATWQALKPFTSRQKTR